MLELSRRSWADVLVRHVRFLRRRSPRVDFVGPYRCPPILPDARIARCLDLLGAFNLIRPGTTCSPRLPILAMRIAFRACRWRWSDVVLFTSTARWADVVVAFDYNFPEPQCLAGRRLPACAASRTGPPRSPSYGSHAHDRSAVRAGTPLRHPTQCLSRLSGGMKMKCRGTARTVALLERRGQVGVRRLLQPCAQRTDRSARDSVHGRSSRDSQALEIGLGVAPNPPANEALSARPSCAAGNVGSSPRRRSSTACCGPRRRFLMIPTSPP